MKSCGLSKQKVKGIQSLSKQILNKTFNPRLISKMSDEKAIECHNSKEYLAGWDLAKDTTIRHMQVIEGFSTE